MTTLRPERYSALAIALHWAIALMLLFQIGLGWALEDLPKGVAQFAGYQFHNFLVRVLAAPHSASSLNDVPDLFDRPMLDSP